ncbi:hypothetical protein PPYR_04288 [Photinus pyralis]|uniref:Guanylate cyclase n=1 Tax=Photinus pyralis TaxID=7054 RepID=A0A5N4AXK6_PHOPY|nr:hypothetical protein PPYR_04288 [Photinus pyralis]
MWGFLTFVFLTTKEVKAETFILGYLTGSERKAGDFEYSRPGLTISGAISLAVEEVNNGKLGEGGHKFEFIVAETYGEEIVSVQKTAELWTRNVSVFIGPQETCKHEAYLAAAFNLPMISYFCTDYETSDKRRFPTFARTKPPNTQISKSIISLLKTFNWTHIVLLYLDSPDFEYGNVALTIQQSLTAAGFTIIRALQWKTPYHQGYTENPFHQLVDDTYQDARIYVIVGHYFEHLALMIYMEEKRLFDNGEYFVIGIDLDEYDQTAPTKYLRDFLRGEKNLVAQRAYQNYLGVIPSSPVGFKNFTALVNTYMEKPPFNFPNPLNFFGLGKMIRAEAAFLYDAVHLYAKSLLHVLSVGGDPRDGRKIIDSLKRLHYKSAMGYMVYIDENGDAGGNYTLIARKHLKNHCEEYGLFPIGTFGLEDPKSGLPSLRMFENFNWVGGRPPVALPQCGFRGEHCVSNTVEITFGVAGGVCLIILISAAILYRNWRYEQELDSLLWKIDYKDIELKINNNEDKPVQNSYPYVRTSQVSLSSNTDPEFRYSSLFTQVAFYKGRMLAIKRINKRSIDITREMKKELKMMRDLHHDNLNGFIGACTDPPNICILTEYCTRGSLKDILENEDVKLDSMFIASLVEDILRGMIFLHESVVRFHGNLHSANCLVDSRWVVKLTDFGLHEFKKNEEKPTAQEANEVIEKYTRLLYRAPELLRKENGTQKGDVYSFGIILYELHGRKGPYGDCALSASEILHRIAQCGSSLRPSLDCLENTVDAVKECLRECWSENPDERPDFKSLRTKLRPLRKGMKPNIFDNMMTMMEKYANNLEQLVDERTDQLQEEKKKTDALLHEMLPKPVAEQLKRGHKVEAESFECVTIFFSDIVGFTATSAESTPLEIVNFLNDLYTCFDSIIENYDVYKVETIGDAYMVVSGLPILNGRKHAAEIATMSLDLLSKVKNFSIRHRPGTKLLLRIGIHSGPVCAGVVGLKMPRYCLFGDTVNTASRMESTGLPLKIHCSQQTMELLSMLGGYYLIPRGEVSIKGKGNQPTYWLLGEDPVSGKLRKFERERRLNNGIGPKSSLKYKHGIIKSPVDRCFSLESPKKLRFASISNLQRKTLDVIEDSSPHKKSASSLIGNSVEGQEIMMSSLSCPCIENLANSSIMLAQTHFPALLSDESDPYRSVPILCQNLMVTNVPTQVISAPVSPFGKIVREEVFPWTDSTPLLKITKADHC